MGSFRYRAVDESGARVAGSLVADTPADARARLRQRRLFAESVEPVEAVAPQFWERLPGVRARNAFHVTVFTRQCAVLLASGVPLAEALTVLARQTEHRGLAHALAEIAESVNAGKSVSLALAGYPQFFDRSYVGIAASGEKSGTMDLVFMRLAESLERRRLMQARLSTALIYPVILIVMAFALLVFLSAYVVPVIKPLLEQHRRPLPLSTQLLFSAGDAANRFWWIIPAAALLAAAALVRMRRSERWRIRMDGWLLRAPLLGRVWMKSLVARFAATFATLLQTGVPAVEALEILRSIVPNAAFAAEVEQIRARVVEGNEISSKMRSSPVFPPMVGYMVAVGERSGSLAEVLEHLSNAYEMEVEIASRRLMAVMEPVLVLVIAGVVGFIAMSLMVTILELSRV